MGLTGNSPLSVLNNEQERHREGVNAHLSKSEKPTGNVNVNNQQQLYKDNYESMKPCHRQRGGENCDNNNQNYREVDNSKGANETVFDNENKYISYNQDNFTRKYKKFGYITFIVITFIVILSLA